MSGITLRYKKPDWRGDQWVFWRCRNLEEAGRIRDMLKSRGYIVEGID